MKKTIKLDFELVIPGRFWALSTSLKGYQLAFQLGKITGLSFSKQADLKLAEGGSGFLNYQWREEFLIFRLFKNKGFPQDGEGVPGFLFPELSQFDFFIYLESDIEEKLSSFASRLEKLQGITLMSEFDPNRFKNKDLLIYNL